MGKISVAAVESISDAMVVASMVVAASKTELGEASGVNTAVENEPADENADIGSLENADDSDNDNGDGCCEGFCSRSRIDWSNSSVFDFGIFEFERCVGAVADFRPFAKSRPLSTSTEKTSFANPAESTMGNGVADTDDGTGGGET